MRLENLHRLTEGLQGFGLVASEEMVQAIGRHLEMVADWNQRVNLTAITDEESMVIKHALDSAMALLVCPVQAGMRVLDVGTGAGFPGVPLKLLVPGIDLVLLDSLQKRCRFLEAVRDEVIAPHGGGTTEVVWGRAEDLGQRQEYREAFDLVVARAVAELRVLAEYCLPFVRVGGRFLAMKGPGAQAEVEGAARALRLLGAEVQEVRNISLPGGHGERTLIRIGKISKTPKEYPRKAGTPDRKPL